MAAATVLECSPPYISLFSMVKANAKAAFVSSSSKPIYTENFFAIYIGFSFIIPNNFSTSFVMLYNSSHFNPVFLAILFTLISIPSFKHANIIHKALTGPKFLVFFTSYLFL